MDGCPSLRTTWKVGSHYKFPNSNQVVARVVRLLSFALQGLLLALVLYQSQTYAATLTGSVVEAPRTIDLTAANASDWAHWGLDGNSGVDRKVGGNARIGDFTAIGGGTPSSANVVRSTYQWSDGTPNASASTRRGLRVFNSGRGFQLELPAGLAPRTLTLYLGGQTATGVLNVSLSDNSAASFSEQIVSPGTRQSWQVTLDYAAASADQTLTVTYTLLTRTNNGWICLEAASLLEALGDQPPIITPIADQYIAEGSALTLQVTAIDPDGPAPLSLSQTNNLPQNPDILADLGGGSGQINYIPNSGDAGAYTVDVSATSGGDPSNGSTASTETFIVNVLPPGSQASMSSNIANAPALIDLTSEGELDWANWGEGGSPTMDHKAFVNSQISDVNYIGSANWSSFNGTKSRYLWSDGAPRVSANLRAGLRSFTPGAAVEVTIPADIASRTATLYVGGRNATVQVTATLAGTAPIVIPLILPSSGKVTREITVDFAAAVSGQLLTLRYELLSATSNGWASFESVTLAGAAINQAPTIVPVPDQSIIEGDLLNFTITATDTDGPAPLLLSSSNTLPGNPEVFSSEAVGVGEVSWLSESGDAANSPYSITVIAADGDGRTTTSTTSVEVLEEPPAPNLPPVIAPIDTQFLNVGETLNLGISATDSDGPLGLTFSQTNSLPGGETASLMNTGSGEASFAWLAPANSEGMHDVTISVTDGGDITTATFTLIVSPAGTTGLLTGTTSVADPTVNLTSVGVSDWIHWGLGGANGEDRKAGVTAQFSSIMPINDTQQSALSFMRSFYTWNDGAPTVSANTRSGLRAFNVGKGYEFTVAASDTPAMVEIYLGAQDATGTLTATLSDSSAPAFSADLSRTGSRRSFRTSLMFAAGSPGQTLTIRYEVKSRIGNGWISVESAALEAQPMNLPPVIDQLPAQTITEGETLSFAITATDPDSTEPPSLAVTSTLPGAETTFVDNGDGSGLVTWVSAAGNASNLPYTLTFEASDTEGATTTREVQVTVDELIIVPNVAPVALPVPDQAAIAGEIVQFTIRGYDTDGPEELTFAIQNGTLPADTGDILSDNGDGTATVEWTTPVDSAGSTYEFEVLISDGEDSSIANVTITASASHSGILQSSAIEAPAQVDLTAVGIADWAHWGLGGNSGFDQKANVVAQIPTFNVLGDATPSFANVMAAEYLWSDGTPNMQAATTSGLRTFDVGRGFTLSIPATNDIRRLQLYVGAFTARGQLTAALSDASAPPLVRSVDQVSGKSSQQITIDYLSSTPGTTLDLTWVVSDNLAAEGDSSGWVSLEAAALVAPNAKPTIEAPESMSTIVGELMEVSFDVLDVDGPVPLVVSANSDTPTAGTLQENGNGNWSWIWTPSVGEIGEFSLTLNATDGFNNTGVADVNLAVAASAAPELGFIADQTLLVGQSLSIPLTASDSDSTAPLVFTQQNTLPVGTVSITPGEATAGLAEATLNWAPDTAPVPGIYSITVTVADVDGDVDSQSFSVEVKANQSPIIGLSGPLSMNPGDLLEVDLLITDSDGPLPLQITETNTLPGDPVTVGPTGLLSWQSAVDDDQASPYSVTVTVTDGLGAMTQKELAIEVELNLRPSITTSGEQTVEEWQTLELEIATSDSDGTVVALSAGPELPGAAPVLTQVSPENWLLQWQADTGSAAAMPWPLTLTATDDLGGTRELLVPITVQPRTLPNIVVILTDDQGVGDTAYSGLSSDLETPALDSLAADGMRFDNFYANSTVCSPTRASLLTGRYPSLVGVPGTVAREANTNMGQFAPTGPTLPEMLKAAGYHTALIGKWHLGDKVVDTTNLPTNRGFDRFRGFLGSAMDYYTHDGSRFAWPGDDLIMDNETVVPPVEHVGIHTTDLFTPWALEYIDERTTNQTQPFFMEMAYTSPHDPVQPPPDVLAAVQAREPGLSEERAQMVALMEHTDQSIGAIIQHLKDRGVYENTLIIYTSDNGGFERFAANNGPYRGGKLDMYEGGIRVPGVVSWPGRIPASSASDEVVVTMDLYPTIAEIVGVEITHEIEGRSVLATLRDQAPSYPARNLIFENRSTIQESRWDMIYAVRSGNWKLVQDAPGGNFELYNLSLDPNETNNLAPTETEKVAELQAVLSAHTAESDLVPWQRELVFEQGTLTNVTDQWLTVPLSQPYREPIVIATPVSAPGLPPVVTRIRNINEAHLEETSFDIRVQRTDGSTEPLADTEVRYMVFEAGVYNVAHHGIKLEALPYTTGGLTNSSSNWFGREWPQANVYAAPVIVGQVITNFDDDFSVFWDRGKQRAQRPTTDSFRPGKHVGNDSNTNRGNEKVGYVIADTGIGRLAGGALFSKAGTTSVVGIDNGTSVYEIEEDIIAENVVLSIAGMRDPDGGWATLIGPQPLMDSSIQLAIDEDQLADLERSHAAEQVAYMVFGNAEPQFQSPADPLTIIAGASLSLDVLASDLDQPDTLTLNLASNTPPDNPATLSVIEPGTGTINWTPRPEDLGIWELTLTADDGQGGLQTQLIAITVEEP